MFTSNLQRFFVLFILRYSRFVLNFFARARYQPCLRRKNPSYGPKNVVCFIPSVDCTGHEFLSTIQSAVETGCRMVYISTIQDAAETAQTVCNRFGPKVRVLAYSGKANKRKQICAALRQVVVDIEDEKRAGVKDEDRIKLLLSLDDHVWIKDPVEFLADALAPFENPVIGGVAVGKKVERVRAAPTRPGDDSYHLLNLLGCFYLLRHNWELSASNTLDGGVFVISGRAACFRAEILTDPTFMSAFSNEYFARPFFGQQIGPLHADDDNFITRWLIEKGWKIKFQYTAHAFITTSLGVDGSNKWLQQCIRWSRTTIRSNLTSLSDWRVWWAYPWTTATVYIPALCNYALLIDPCLLWLCWKASAEVKISPYLTLSVLVLWILATKMVKLYPHIRAYPEDIWLLPVQVGFGYFHSLIKLYSTLTFWELGWGSRPEAPDRGTYVDDYGSKLRSRNRPGSTRRLKEWLGIRWHFKGYAAR